MLVWDQRVAHGTAPNTSRSCRMAQYLKAFLRQPSFPSGAGNSVGAGKVSDNSRRNEGGDDVSDGAEGSNSEMSKDLDSRGTRPSKEGINSETNSLSATDNNNNLNPVPQGVSQRLLRRSTALDYILKQNHSRDIVTPLGETLFALDVLL